MDDLKKAIGATISRVGTYPGGVVVETNRGRLYLANSSTLGKVVSEWSPNPECTMCLGHHGPEVEHPCE